jgi:MoCo/4Fe-4S cofactor protein with predicted Tat translocation signal
MSSTKRYWMDLGDLHQAPEVIKGRENEFPTDLAIDQVLADPNLQGASTGRRDFLKFLGFSLGAATLGRLRDAGGEERSPTSTSRRTSPPVWPTGTPAPSMMVRIMPASW